MPGEGLTGGDGLTSDGLGEGLGDGGGGEEDGAGLGDGCGLGATEGETLGAGATDPDGTVPGAGPVVVGGIGASSAYTS